MVPGGPLSRLVGLRLTQVGSGAVTFTIPAAPWLQHADGVLDVKMLIEVSLHGAVLTTAPPAMDVRAASLSVDHLRPPTLEGESFIARARVLHTGPTFTLGEVVVEDGLGRGVAHATGSYLMERMHPPPVPGDLPPYEEPVYATPDPYRRPLPADTFIPPGPDRDALTYGRLLLAGELSPPPIHQLMGFRFVDIGEGSCSFALPASPWLHTWGRSVTVAAGPIACLAHFGLSGAAYTLVPMGFRLGILDQSMTFLRTVPADGRDLVAQGRVVHQVGPFHVAIVEVVDADANLVCTGHQTSLVTERRRRDVRAAAERTLATVVFTDIVDSTPRAEQLGDAAWRTLLAEHHAAVRRQLDLWNGREVKTTGDGFLLTFESPARALQCARAIRDAAKRISLDLRIGVHTGECDVVDGDVAGIAVHVAPRVQAGAAPGEILVSGTVRDLVAGSGLRFTERGRHKLRGIDGEWELLALAD